MAYGLSFTITVEKSEASGAARVVYDTAPVDAPLGGLPPPRALPDACGMPRQTPAVLSSFSQPSWANCVYCSTAASPPS
ncbi:hypothetical protein Q0F99_05010 [Rathayibacter oskolensis]|uniref:hypothetical protein n=1 Tax=Rathayibacter oskolensis TaxID=1891671 RepID=UPI00265D6D02|nr:hypothetical protein [Rathayibacter oskolensis]WKK72345.1 hypothetical protein Q0F99_05010 [Rathayibacter oskolensis]